MRLTNSSTIIGDPWPLISSQFSNGVVQHIEVDMCIFSPSVNQTELQEFVDT